jgi:hypothetical protein
MRSRLSFAFSVSLLLNACQTWGPTWKPVIDHVEPIAGCLVPAPAK